MRTILFGTIAAAILTASSYAAATQQDSPVRPDVTACFTNSTHSCVPVSSVDYRVPHGSFITFQLSDPLNVVEKVNLFTSLGNADDDGSKHTFFLDNLPEYSLPGPCIYMPELPNLKARRKAATEQFNVTSNEISFGGFGTIWGRKHRNETHQIIPTMNGEMNIPRDDTRGMYDPMLCLHDFVREEYVVYWIVSARIDGGRRLIMLGPRRQLTVGPESDPATTSGDVQPPALLTHVFLKSGAEMKGVGWMNVFSVVAALASLYLI
ncbi:hypothetical protein HDU85_007651 [Gaertneriomyces sp. JEL0708]|nr:hypothetical protein HDU85_007651 [Gaertneriomyces sp. JEL0708]